MSLMNAQVLNDSRNSFPLLCKWKKYCFQCKISKTFVNVKRQNLTERRELNREILVSESAPLPKNLSSSKRVLDDIWLTLHGRKSS